MARGSDNLFPQILIVEGSAPSVTASGTYPGIPTGDQALFIDSADHLPKLVNHAGAVAVLGGGAAPSLILNFEPSADQIALTTMTSGTWYDVCSNQSFTVTNAAAQIMIAVAGLAYSDGASGNNFLRINVDSAGTPITKLLSGAPVPAVAVNPFAGGAPIGIGTLSAAAHTVKVQVSSNTTGNRIRLQPTTQAAAQEFLRLQVWQMG